MKKVGMMIIALLLTIVAGAQTGYDLQQWHDADHYGQGVRHQRHYGYGG